MEMTRSIVEEAVRERMDRMQSDRVDLLQVGRDTPGSIPSVHGLSVDGTCHETSFPSTHFTDGPIDSRSPKTPI